MNVALVIGVRVREIALTVIFAVVIAPMAACTSPQARRQVQLVPREIHPALPSEGFARVGGNVFVTRVAREADALQMSRGIYTTMPGTLGVNFNFAIEKSLLVLEYQSDEYYYYPAPRPAISAYSMGSSVLGVNDEIGARLSKRDGTWEWYVDNSSFNGQSPGTVIWSRPMDEGDDVKLTKTKVVLPLKEPNAKYITFAGYSSNTLNFTYAEQDLDYEVSRKFVFNKSDSHPSIVKINGAEFEVLDVSSEGIEFKAVKGFN